MVGNVESLRPELQADAFPECEGTGETDIGFEKSRAPQGVINLINGFSFGKPVWYMSMDTSIPLGAAIEHNTYAPLMANLHLGGDDSFSSPIERIFISTNGPQDGGCANPLRQGLSADLLDGYRPNNVLGGIPSLATD